MEERAILEPMPNGTARSPRFPAPPAAAAWEERWRALISGQACGAGAAAARTALWALSGVYGGVVGAYRLAYDWGLIRTRPSGSRVISVGNLTVGGTGKSTTVKWLASWLRDRGVPVAVISYGYRAQADAAVTVVSDGRQILVPEPVSGDEPRMLAEALPEVPVLIARRRQLAAAEAVRRFGAAVCVLDDAFQYWRLEKDLDLVLIDALQPFGGGYLLPRGLLRERTRQLRRADAILLTNAHRVSAADRARLRRQLRELSPEAIIAEARHSPRPMRPLRQGATARQERQPAPSLQGQRVMALSSLGNPQRFEQTLTDLGICVVPARFPDHHHYRQEELRSVEEAARVDGCAAIVTTEKDAVKIDPIWVRSVPIHVLPVEMAFDAGQPELELLLQRLLAQDAKG